MATAAASGRPADKRPATAVAGSPAAKARAEPTASVSPAELLDGMRVLLREEVTPHLERIGGRLDRMEER
eukprot:8443464-Prorocentrum_lima.AAC.1